MKKIILLILLTAIWSVNSYSQSIALNFKFHQVDFYDEDDQLKIENSSWGYLEVDFIYHPDKIYYLNLQAQGATQPVWLIKNYPVFPNTIGQGALKQGIDFDISSLGISAGIDFPNINYNYTLDTSVEVNPQLGVFNSAPVLNLKRFAFGSRLLGPLLPLDIGVPFGIQADAAPTDVIQHKNVPGVQEGVNQCLPGSMARSIKWLGQENNFAEGKTAQEIYDILAGFDNPTRLSYEQFVHKKDSFLKTLNPKAKTKVLDLNNAIGPIDGVKEETGKDLKEWLKEELEKGDVELHYDRHIVTVTGMYKQGGKCYIKYRDDENQGDDTKGDTGEKTGELKKNGDNYEFKSAGGAGYFTVQAAIAEYIDPTSSVFERNSSLIGAYAYPNPAKDAVNLNFYSRTDSKVLVSVINITGQEIISRVDNASQGSNSLWFDISGLPSGMYFVRVEDVGGEGAVSFKVLKE